VGKGVEGASLWTYEVEGKNTYGDPILAYVAAGNAKKAKGVVEKGLHEATQGSLTAKRVSWIEACEGVGLTDESEGTRKGLRFLASGKPNFVQKD